MKNGSPTPFVALAAAMDLPESEGAPEWVHLLPAAQGEIHTYDARGPYRLADIEAVIAASMQSERGMPIDENHATDTAMQNGNGAPARGWIKELQARADGLWGRVEWTKAGAELLADRAYRGISPVFNHLADKTITRVLRASLTNKPNLKGLVALNEETAMNLAAIAKALGLGEDADEAAILAAIEQMKKPDDTAMQSALVEIGTVLGVEGGDPAAVLAAAKSAKSGETVNTALQAEVTNLAGQLKSLKDQTAKDKAISFVDGAIAQGRAGVKPQRDRFIAMHMEDAAGTESLIAGLPALGGDGKITPQPPAQGAEITSLNAEQTLVADQLGIPHDKFLASLQADAKKEAR